MRGGGFDVYIINTVYREAPLYFAKIIDFRVKILQIGSDIIQPVEMSNYFALPYDQKDFIQYLCNVCSEDVSNNLPFSLEGLNDAIISNDWIQKGDYRRHVIILFSQNNSSPLLKYIHNGQMAIETKLESSYNDVINNWNNAEKIQYTLHAASGYRFDSSKRLILITPSEYPWTKMECEFEYFWREDFDKIHEPEHESVNLTIIRELILARM